MQFVPRNGTATLPQRGCEARCVGPAAALSIDALGVLIDLIDTPTIQFKKETLQSFVCFFQIETWFLGWMCLTLVFFGGGGGWLM